MTNNKTESFQRNLNAALDAEVKAALFDYEHLCACGKFLESVLPAYRILGYAKRGLLKNKNGDPVVCYTQKTHYVILRLVKQGLIVSNVKVSN